MKKRIAAFLRRVAQRLDPQKTGMTGYYARKVVDFIPYRDIETYRELVMAGDEERARIVKGRMKYLAEISAYACVDDALRRNDIVRLEHNLGHDTRVIDGIRCPAEGVTVIVELKGTWL